MCFYFKRRNNQVSEEKKLGVVLYVDGGCRMGYPKDADSKYGGWGIHGYSYNVGEYAKQKKTKKDTPSTIGYVIGDKVSQEEQVVPVEYIDGYGSMTNMDTSDRAELKGFKEALEIVKTKNYSKAHFLLDNQYVIKGATGGYEEWTLNNWKRNDGSDRPNREIWDDIMKLYGPIRQNTDFSIQWVNGHSGDLGNDRADYLATKGVYLGRNGFTDVTSVKFSKPAKYRNPEPKINRLLSKNRWYFDTFSEKPLMSKDGRYVYHCGAHGSDNSLIGKPMSDSVAYVVYTKEEQKVLEQVRLRHRELIDNPLNLLCMGRLDTLLLPRIYDEIDTDGIYTLSLAPRKLNFKGLCTIDEQEVTRLIEPSGLTFKLIEVHNFMQTKLDSYLDGNATLTDITDIIYDKVEVKKKTTYRMKLTPEVKKLEIKAKVDDSLTYKCSFTIGIDIPSRETMKAIEDREPKVYITTFKISDAAFRYAVIFDCGDDCMMWIGKDSSFQLIFPENQ